MTKKLSILSIVVVLLFSLCLVGCGDSSGAESKSDNDSVALEDYSKEIVGTWKLVEVISKNGRDSNKLDGSVEWVFNSDGTCIYNKLTNPDGGQEATYKFSATTSEIEISTDGWMRITKFTKKHLEINFDGTFVLERK